MNTLRYLEPLVKRDDHDPALITPRLEAFKAMERARKSGDARLLDDANARLGELAAMEMEEL